MTLYGITERFKLLVDGWDDSITDEEFGDLMFELDLEFKDKVQNCGYFIRNTEADITALDAEIDRLAARKAAMERRITSVKKYVQIAMETMTVEKLSYPEFDFRIQNNPPRVQITDEAKIPANYWKVKTTETIDKKAIKDAGGCEGAEIVQDKGLRIK